jgi:intraflagellar transport protein 172
MENQLGWEDMAFILLNSYLDITEAMEECSDRAILDNNGFEKSDILYDFPVPAKHFVEGKILGSLEIEIKEQLTKQ